MASQEGHCGENVGMKEGEAEVRDRETWNQGRAMLRQFADQRGGKTRVSMDPGFAE